tara:strand:+ start:101603 stop:101779 length:177 start_codon:yes stop_codon:yes gene_type:complete
MTIFKQSCRGVEHDNVGVKKIKTNKFMWSAYAAPQCEEKASAVKLLSKERLCCDQATD